MGTLGKYFEKSGKLRTGVFFLNYDCDLWLWFGDLIIGGCKPLQMLPSQIKCPAGIHHVVVYWDWGRFICL